MPTSIDRTHVERHVRELHERVSRELALDATITPETFASAFPSAKERPERETSVGTLPRIALSGATGTTKSAESAGESADFEIVGLLGEGGMGRVHLARQRSLGREVALKMLRDHVRDSDATDMLRVEATVMGRLEHPNVVPVHAVGRDASDRLVLVMKRIEGAPWRDLLRDPEHPRWQALAPRVEDRLEVHLNVLTQVANALALAHDRGIVHRDVKPENVLLGSHGEVYLADWGVALKTEGATGSDLVGTPAYMAPEMVVGARDQIDGRTDVYLLGATLHEVLTGSPPHAGDTLQATLLMAFDGTPKRYDPSIPSELAAIARKAMAREPSDRYASALELRRALDELRAHRGSLALLRAGRELLERLEEDVPKADASADVDRRLTECRFALVSALREWPENADAKSALRACLRLSIRRELSRENAAAARSLMSELGTEDAALEAEIAVVEARAKAREEELARLRSLDADRDLSVGFRGRVFVSVALFCVALAMAAFAASRAHGGPISLDAWEIVRFGAIGTTALVALIFLARRTLLANEIGRQLSLLFVLAMGGTVVHRVIAALYEVPSRATLTMDLVLLGVVGIASGTVVRRSVWSGVPPFVAVGLALAFPERLPMIFALSALLLLVSVTAAGWLDVREKKKSADSR